MLLKTMVYGISFSTLSYVYCQPDGRFMTSSSANYSCPSFPPQALLSFRICNHFLLPVVFLSILLSSTICYVSVNHVSEFDKSLEYSLFCSVLRNLCLLVLSGECAMLSSHYYAISF